MGNKNVPEVRFPGFYDSWKKSKFVDLLDLDNGIRRGPFGSALKKDLFVPESDYVVYEQQNAIYNKWETRYNITEEKFHELSKFVLIEDDFIMSGAGTIGRISKVPKGIKQGVFNQALIRFRINKSETDSDYFLEWVRSENIQRKFTESNPGSAMTNLVPMSEVKEWEILVPKLNEQQLIGKFCTQLTDMITIHQQELTSLKETKQGFSQKMYPKEGESVPEIRFPGFSGEWVEQCIEDLSENTFGGGTPKTTIKEYWNGNIPWIQSSDLSQHKLSGIKPNKKITEIGLGNSATKIIPKQSIAIVTRVGVGKIALIEEEYSTSQDFISLSNLKVNTWFAVYSLYRLLQKELHKVQGTSIKGITKKELLEKKIKIPFNKNEQTQIGNFFKQLDETIALHEQELENLKKTKQAFLQKMFV